MVSSHAGKSLSEVLAEIEARHRDISYFPTLAGFAPLLRTAHQRFYSTGTDANGNAWAPLRPSTIKKKGHGIILVDQDPLMDSLTKNTGDTIWSHNERAAVFGTSVFYAKFHQSGGVNLPIRAPVGVDAKTLDVMVDRVADREVQVLKG